MQWFREMPLQSLFPVGCETPVGPQPPTEYAALLLADGLKGQTPASLQLVMRLFRTSFKCEVTISGSFSCREHLFAQSEGSTPRIREKDKRETDLDEYITTINH